MKDDGSDVYADLGSLSGLAVFNAIPNSTGANLLLDGDRLNMTNEKLSFGAYMPHRNVYPGGKSLTVENLNSKGESQRVVHNISLVSGAIYSLFLYEENGIQSVLSKDNIVSPVSGYAKVRIAHMVKDAPALTLWSGKPAQIVSGNVSFKAVTDFVAIKAGEPLTLKIIPADGKTTLPEIILTDFTLDDKGMYTFLIKGLLNTSNEKEELSLTVIKF